MSGLNAIEMSSLVKEGGAMSIDVQRQDRIEMSQKERDVLRTIQNVVAQSMTQAKAAELLGLSVRQVRRLQRKLEAGGDAALIHGLRGKPSNHQPDRQLKHEVLQAYRQRYSDFGPTFASEKLAEEEGLTVCPQTLRRWLIDAGLWQGKRRREAHRSRRPRRDCFGELVQMDASIHDWLEGRGEELVLITMIDDATSRVLARFYPTGTTETHMDLLGHWLRKYGRPQALYTDRHSIFEPQDKGRALPDAVTQFGRALKELSIDLICAHSPQAKGRVERNFGTGQDRWVKELRLAKVTTCVGANEVLQRLLPAHNRRFAKPARLATDMHRPLGPGHNLESILSIQEERVVANDYTIRFRNRFYQLLKPIYPGERGGKVVIELRLDGSMAIRFRGNYLKHHEIPAEAKNGGSAPRPPEFSACPADAREGEESPAPDGAGPTGMQPTGGRSGCTPAEPCPPDGDAQNSQKTKGRPAKDHPWRKPFKPHK
jgi:transposase